MSTNEYGYIGAGHTQSNTSNSGVFDNEDVYNLIDEGKWALQPFDIDYLVLAGGGGGGFQFGGGGGAGGYRTSYTGTDGGGGSEKSGMNTTH